MVRTGPENCFELEQTILEILDQTGLDQIMTDQSGPHNLTLEK
jgi:hypothetical protein